MMCMEPSRPTANYYKCNGDCLTCDDCFLKAEYFTVDGRYTISCCAGCHGVYNNATTRQPLIEGLDYRRADIAAWAGNAYRWAIYNMRLPFPEDDR